MQVLQHLHVVAIIANSDGSSSRGGGGQRQRIGIDLIHYKNIQSMFKMICFKALLLIVPFGEVVAGAVTMRPT